MMDLDQQNHFWCTAVENRLAAVELRLTGRYPGSPEVQCRDLGDLLITDWKTPDVEGVRPRRMAERDAEALLLFTFFAGRQIIETSQQTAVGRPGDVVIMTTRTTEKIIVPEKLHKRTVRIPLAALSSFDTGHGIPDCLVMSTGQNPLASLAHDYLLSVGRRIDQMTPVEVEGARNALLVLIAGMIRATHAPDVGEEDFLPLLRQQLEAWIVEHLHLGAIRVRELAAAHNVAARTVHRAFAATGDTVGSVVRAHRIAAARADLVNTTSPITAIAHRWGFSDASHLGREFRREFSTTPSGYRAAYAVV